MPRRFESSTNISTHGGEHDVTLGTVPNDRIGLAGNEAVNHLRNLLDRTGIFNVQRDPYQDKKHQQQAEHQELHGKCLE